MSANDIAKIFGKDKRVINRWAKEDGWAYRTADGNGGKQKRFHITKLPEDIQRAYAAGLDLSFEAFQNELKPVPKAEVKGRIERYAGRSPAEKPVKPLDSCTEAERGIALNRQKVIAAYDESGLSVKEFISFYNNGGMPEVSERLGRWGQIGSPTAFYRNWLKRYRQFGLAGLVPQYQSRGGDGATLSDEARDRIERLYLDSSKPSMKSVVDNLPQYGITVGYDTVRRYIQTIPASTIAKYRMGKKYFHDKYEPYIVRNYTKYKPMEVICGDYMTEDIFCRIDDRVFRAKLCAFEDMRSRMIVGWSRQTTANSVG